jgi:CHAT domain-containing protein
MDTLSRVASTIVGGRRAVSPRIALLALSGWLLAAPCWSQASAPQAPQAARPSPDATDDQALTAAWTTARLAAARLEFPAAETRLRSLLNVKAGGARPGPAMASALGMDLAMVVAHQGRLAEAKTLLRSVGPIITQSGSPIDTARLAAYEAQIALIEGDFAAGQAQAQRAVALWRAIAEAANKNQRGLVTDPSGSPLVADAELALALNLEAVAALRGGDSASAAVRASEALVILDRAASAPPWWRADILATLGEANGQLGRLSAAEQYLRTAIAQRQRLFGNGPATMRAWLGLGRAYQTEALDNNAILAFREAIAIATTLPRQRALISDEDLIPLAQAVYRQAQGTLSPRDRQGLLGELFAAFQLSRSQDRDHLSNVAAARMASDQPALQALLAKLDDTRLDIALIRSDLSKAELLPDASVTATQIADLTARLAQATTSANTLSAQIAQSFPQYHALVQPPAYPLDAVRSRLAPDEAVAMFLVGRTTAFLLLVRRDGLTLAPINAGQSALADAVRTLRRGLEIEGRSVAEFDLTASHHLYTTLFSGAAVGLSGISRLTIVPADVLAALPFSVLVSAPPATGDYAAAHWLVRDHRISQAPSLASFMYLRSTRLAAPAPRSLLAIANPSLSGTQPGASVMSQAFAGCRLTQTVEPQLLRSLTPLPETEREVRAVAAAIAGTDATILAGNAATEPQLLQTDMGQYRVLYFATHGLVPGELQCQTQPGLVLSPPAGAPASAHDDGFLDASEISALKLRANLVVLSACNTASPGAKALGTGSLSGLADAFVVAGARSVLATHWQVPSNATAQLMQQTFAVLSRNPGLGTDGALQDAQKAAIANPQTAHPFFWGAFVVIGDGAGQPLATQGAGQ